MKIGHWETGKAGKGWNIFHTHKSEDLLEDHSCPHVRPQEDFVAKIRLRQRNAVAFFLYRKLCFCKEKTLREDRTAADWKMSLKRPATGGESRKLDSLFRKKGR